VLPPNVFILVNVRGNNMLARVIVDVVSKQLQGTLALQCQHHWRLDPSDEVCRCTVSGEAHYHAACRLCLTTRTFPSYIETGPIAKAAVYAKRGGKAKWKGVETAEAPPKERPC
jgi:hypothetical protein